MPRRRGSRWLAGECEGYVLRGDFRLGPASAQPWSSLGQLVMVSRLLSKRGELSWARRMAEWQEMRRSYGRRPRHAAWAKHLATQPPDWMQMEAICMSHLSLPAVIAMLRRSTAKSQAAELHARSIDRDCSSVPSEQM